MNLYDKFAWSHGSTAIDSMSLFHLQRWYTILFSTTFLDTMSTKKACGQNDHRLHTSFIVFTFLIGLK